MKAKKEIDTRKWQIRTLLALVLLVAMGSFGWWWKGQVQFRAVQLSGAQHAEEAALLELAQIDTNMAFFDIDPYAIADRVQQHPWVREASVQRLPNATIDINVVERVPAILAIDKEGRADRYLDAEGYQMPFLKEAVYDVPLLTGLTEKINLIEPLKHEGVNDLLEALEGIPQEVDALLSVFEIVPNGGIDLQTTPKPGRGAIQVHLGRGDYAYKLTKLNAFWRQAVLQKVDTDFESIDLRFDSQIITQETRLSQ